MRRPTFAHARAALRLYDGGLAHRDAMLANIQNDRDFEVWSCAEEQAQRRVQNAFYLDTRDRNHLDTIRFCMTARDIREMVAP